MASVRSQNEVMIQSAINDLRNGAFASKRAAGRAHNVDRSTLTRRMRGGLNPTEFHAPYQLLSPTQESLLARWIIELDHQGHTRAPAEAKEMAVQILMANGVHDPKIGKRRLS